MGSFKGKREMMKYMGDASQLFGVKDYRMIGGRADGVRAVDVKNGSGLQFTVLPDRCLDIYGLTYKGINLSYLSKTGIVAPQYYNDRGAEWLRSFFAGLMTTCGLTQVGAPCVDNGVELGVHGRIANTPAEEVYAGTEWENDVPVMRVKGRIRETIVFGENLILSREIVCRYGENKIYINDSVENLGYREEPLMLLYHINMGYPLLSENSYFAAPSMKVIPSTEEAAKGLSEYNKCQKPTPGFNEHVFYHDLKVDSEGRTFAALVNPEINLAVAIRFNKNELSNLAQWKQMGEGDYVMGIEPSNCFTKGRAKAREDGTLQFIKPGEIKHFNVEIEVIDGEEKISELVRSI